MVNIERIKELMEKQGTNNRELAKAAGVSEGFMTRMLNGCRAPSLEVAKRIANYFNVKIDDLI